MLTLIVFHIQQLFCLLVYLPLEPTAEMQAQFSPSYLVLKLHYLKGEI